MNRDTANPPWDDNFKDITLTFSDGNTKNKRITNTEERVWDTIDLVSNGNVITSSYVKLTALTIYGNNDNSFAELKVFGCT